MIEFVSVKPNLFVGTCPSNEVDVKQIRTMGVTGIFNLQTDADFVKWKVDFDEVQQTAYDLDLVIQRLPIIDFDDEDLARYLADAVKMLHRMLAIGHTVYLHCTAGRDRSPTVAVAYLSKFGGMELDEAADYLQSLRTCRPKLDIISDYLSNT